MNQLIVKKQAGTSLVIVMLLFVALTVVGLSVLRSGLLSEKQSVNMQEKSVSFHTAQSSNSAVVQSFDDATFRATYLDEVVNKAPKTNSIPELLNNTVSYETCVGENGVIGNCADAALDGGSLVGKTKSFYRGCSAGGLSCPGNSAVMGGDGNVACIFFEHKAVGFIDSNGNKSLDSDETNTKINQWTQGTGPCDTSIQ